MSTTALLTGDPRTYAILGAAIEVHRQLGPGFLEAVYQHAMALELACRGIPFRQQVDLPIRYKGVRLPCAYRADFTCFDAVIVELKALRAVSGTEEAQVINYLKATSFRTALLLNFGTHRLSWKRLVDSRLHLRPSAPSADD